MSSPKQKEPTPQQTPKQTKEKPGTGRNTFVYVGTIIILVIVVVAFIFVPSARGPSDVGRLPDFGTYAGTPIRYEQGGYMARQVQAINDQLKSYGYDQSGNQFFAFQVWKGAFDRTVVHTALLHEARKAGITVSEDRLNEAILEAPDFQEEGKFSLERYRETSEARKLAIRTSLREEILKNYILEDALSLRPSSREIAFIQSMAREERVIEYVVLPFSAFSDEQKAAFGRDNPAKFRRIDLSRITLNDEKEAGTILAAVKQGSQSFEEAAKAHSKDAWAEKGGASGSRWGYELEAELAQAQDAQTLLSLKAGEISPVFKTAAGSWAFFRAEAPAAEPDFNSSDTLKAVWEYMNKWERGKIEDAAILRGKDFAVDAAARGFTSAASSYGLTVRQAGPFPLAYGEPFSGGSAALFRKLSGEGLEGASTSEKFMTSAFTLGAGAVSEPVLLKDAAVVLRVKEIRPADDSGVQLIEFYYPYLFAQAREIELYEKFLASPELKDNFSTAFFQIFRNE